MRPTTKKASSAVSAKKAGKKKSVRAKVVSKKTVKSKKKSAKKAAKKSGGDFAPPVWCGDPCPTCSYVCGKRANHTEKHACLNRHRW